MRAVYTGLTGVRYDEPVEQIYSFLSSLVSAGVMAAFAGSFVWWHARVQHSDWTKYEPRYACDDLPEPVASELAGAVRIALTGEPGVYPTTKTKWKSFISVTVGVHSHGISLAIKPLLRFGSKDLFLPFGEMQVGTVKWLGWTDHFGFSMDGVSGLEIVIPRKVIQKIAPQSETLSRLVNEAIPSHTRAA